MRVVGWFLKGFNGVRCHSGLLGFPAGNHGKRNGVLGMPSQRHCRN
jgi:hypothetical protein